MLEYTRAGDGTRLAMLLLHDDVACVNTPTGRPMGCGTARSAPSVRCFYDEAKKGGWVVISMKKDWKRVFAFEE